MTDSLALDAVARLADAVRRRLSGREEQRGPWRVERVSVKAPLAGDMSATAMRWLAAQPHAAKSYWHGRAEMVQRAGVGIADEIAGGPFFGWDELEERAAALPVGARYVGGGRFADTRAAAPEWEPFGNARFVLPRVEYAVRNEHATLTAHLVLPRDAGQVEAVCAEIERIAAPPDSTAEPLPLPIARADLPGREQWRREVEHALQAFGTSHLEKVVLARRVCYTFEEALDPFALAAALERATPGCFHFLFQPEPSSVFVGASPERLFRRGGEVLQSEAVAGTRPRGVSDAADAALRDELQGSDKDQREHAFVREQICRVLDPMSQSVTIDAEASDLTLARGRHLYSRIEADLHDGVRTADLLAALHPTPAVGGTPTDVALKTIAAAEPFDRGWYAGPVGWIGADAAEFAVAIRSGLVEQAEDGSALLLYSGAGIVEGSDPEAEWDEIEHKISDFARVLALDV